MKDLNIKKWFGILLMAIGIIGFIFNANKKNDMKVFEKRVSTNQPQNFTVELSANHVFEIKFWGVDEEMTQTFNSPTFSSNIEIINEKGDLIFNESLESVISREIGGKRVTHDGLSFSYETQEDEIIQIHTQITMGDYMDVEVYEDLSSEADALPGVFIILAIIGLVLFLRGRNN